MTSPGVTTARDASALSTSMLSGTYSPPPAYPSAAAGCLVATVNMVDAGIVKREKKASLSLPYTITHRTLTILTMNRQGGEAFAKLAQQLNRARQQASGGRGGGNPFNGMPSGGQSAGGLLLVLGLVGGGVVLSNSIYNGA